MLMQNAKCRNEIVFIAFVKLRGMVTIMEENVKYSIKQHIKLILRGYKEYNALNRAPAVVSLILSSLVEAAVPFINLYFTAMILNELAGAREPQQLTRLVLWTISLNLIALLTQKGLERWAEYCNCRYWINTYKVHSDKMLALDFGDAESPEIRKQYNDINGHHNGIGFGLGRLRWGLTGISGGLVRVAFSLTLIVALLRASVSDNSLYHWLDSPWITIAALIILILMVLLPPYFTVLGGKIYQEVTHHNSKGNRFFHFYFISMIQGSDTAKDIRIYRQRPLMESQMKESIRFFSRFRRYAKYDAKMNLTGTAIACICNGAIYLLIALKALGGAFGVGEIILYVGAVVQFNNGFSSMLTSIGQLIINNPFLDKVFKYLDIPNPMYKGSLTTEKRSGQKYEIELRDVSFKYPSSDGYAIKNVSMKLNVGERLAIVGENGSGKTTFIKLLCRLYDPTEGEILLNGIDIKKYDYDEYKAIFSVVFQDFELLPLTLGQNVAVGVNYDEEKVRQALDNAGFTPRLETMPNGLDTYLYKNFEDDGVEPSGGEAQKIALARALYKEAPFIILDEPTAALDPIAEFEVYSKMNDIVGDKTAVFISHRLSSCRFCSDIAVFHEGRLIQRGSHDDLVAVESDKYYDLWNAQAQYYE